MASTRRRRLFSQPAVAGLLITCGLLGAGLLATAYFSYLAAERAARDVIFSRAADVAASFSATARLTGASDSNDPTELARLAKETAGEQVSIAVYRLDGSLVAATDVKNAAAGVPAPAIQQKLRLTGQAHRFDENSRTLVYWQPLGHGPRRGGGAGILRRWWRHQKRFRGKGPRWRPGPHPPKLLQVTVPYSTADPLMSPARTTLLTAAAGSALLVLLGVLLYRAARKAQQTERELQRREALSALGEMGAVLAHEIRTPLASIKGNAQLIEESHRDDQRALAIVSESSRLERLVNGMLDYAQPGEPRRSACNPDQVMARAVEIVSPKARAAGVAVVTDPGGFEGQRGLEADPDQLLQVLVNLLQNAIEATAEQSEQDRDEAPIVIRARRHIGEVSFTVLDRGPGFGQDDHDRLFRPFFSRRRSGGTGLGLAIARQIVQQHGGELRLQNRPDGGAQVTATLPAKATALAQQATET